MATHCTISVVNEDDTVSSIYCHYDGMPQVTLVLLAEYYNDLKKAQALVALGYISFLEESIECPVGHTFETPIRGYTVAYGRDRGETSTAARCYKSVDEYKARGLREQYNYLFANGVWEII